MKTGFDTEVVDVKELSFQSKRGDLKCFLVKVPIHRKDELYKAEFWPKNVGFERFNIHVY